jgi:outer membrane protein assembly factor BamE
MLQQGNVLKPEVINQVKPGMTRKQVQYILGTPLVADVFHKNRWDFYYTLQPEGRKITEKQRVTILFDGDRVTRIIHHTGDSAETDG